MSRKDQKMKDFYDTPLSLKDTVVFTDKVSGRFKRGEISEFKPYTVGVQAVSSETGRWTVYWRNPKELVKLNYM